MSAHRRIGIDARKLDRGGIGRYVRELLARLPVIGHDVELVALGEPHLAASIAAIDPRIEFVSAHAPGYSLRELVELGRIARRAKLALLHLPHYLMPFACACPTVVTVHDLIHLRLPRSPAHALYSRWMLARVRRQADVILTPSRATARDLIDLVGCDERKVRVVPHGVSAGFAPAGPRESAREFEEFLARHGLRRPYVLNVSNGLPHKGLDLLLRAWRGLAGVQLVVAGIGSDRPRSREQLAAEPDPVRQATLLLGMLSQRELVLAYRGASAVVVPSLLEGFGFPALEAMASGVPVIASDAGSLPEIVGDAGIIVAAGCVDKLKDAVYTMVFAIGCAERDGIIRRGLARSGRFSWEDAAHATFAAYEQALGTTP